jgi:hypothetical protein
MSLSFDEFRAVSKRNSKAQAQQTPDKGGLGKEEDENEEQDDPRHQDDVADENEAEAEGGGEVARESGGGASNDQAKAAFTVGDFLEMQEIQGLTLLFLLLATFAAFAELSVVNNASSYSKAHVFSLVVQVARSVASFFTFFFAFEMVSLIIAFRLRIFGHLGYIVDMGVVGLQVWAITTGVFAVECHILNIFRMWRLVRLFQSMVSVEIEAHSEARQAVKSMSVKKKKLEDDVEKLTLNLQKEQLARSSVEAMLQDYKDEIDTLNEALKIAALDIAEVAQAEDDFFLSDEEDIDDMMSTDMSASERSEGVHRRADTASNVSLMSNDTENSATVLKKKEELYREARATSKSVPQTKHSTFVINENGSVQPN